MTSHEALRKVEAALVALRTISATDFAFERYRAVTLPAGDHPQIEQGFDAGWNAACHAFSAVVNAVQTEALREPAEVGT